MKKMPGVDNRPITLIQFDALNMDRFSLMGGKYSKGGKSFSSTDFMDDEEYEEYKRLGDNGMNRALENIIEKLKKLKYEEEEKGRQLFVELDYRENNTKQTKKHLHDANALLYEKIINLAIAENEKDTENWIVIGSGVIPEEMQNVYVSICCNGGVRSVVRARYENGEFMRDDSRSCSLNDIAEAWQPRYVPEVYQPRGENNENNTEK